jgi:hypothetical protein
MQLRVALVAAAIVSVCAGGRAQQAFTMDQLLDRATVFVEDLVAKLSRVVSEEQYVQEYLLSTPEGSRGSFLGSPKVIERRTLKSDFLLVKPSGLEQWFVFRDVFDVDGRPVRDRENRLSKLFLESRDTVTAIERALEIGAASAQFNIRQFGTVDNPVLALGLLQRVYRQRLRFTLGGRDISVGPDVWVLEFRETGRPSIIRASGNRDIFAKGRYWIDAERGELRRSEVVFNALGTETTTTTTFAPDERLATSVPTEMHFRRAASTNEVRGVATYGALRRFEVGTEETLQK